MNALAALGRNVLQIAKNASLPPSLTSGEPKTISSGDEAKSQVVVKPEDKSGIKVDGATAVSANIPTNLEVDKGVLESAKKLVIKTELIPECSYSSSDDDDDFFDAEEAGEETVPEPAAAAAVAADPLTPTSLGDDIDYDALYEPDEGDEKEIL